MTKWLLQSMCEIGNYSFQWFNSLATKGSVDRFFILFKMAQKFFLFCLFSWDDRFFPCKLYGHIQWLLFDIWLRILRLKNDSINHSLNRSSHSIVRCYCVVHNKRAIHTHKTCIWHFNVWWNVYTHTHIRNRHTRNKNMYILFQ